MLSTTLNLNKERPSTYFYPFTDGFVSVLSLPHSTGPSGTLIRTKSFLSKSGVTTHCHLMVMSLQVVLLRLPFS